MRLVNAHEFTRRLRMHPALQRKWLIADTGDGQSAARERSLELGFQFQPIDPLDVAMLDGELQQWALMTQRGADAST
jgi:hypothetical protein